MTGQRSADDTRPGTPPALEVSGLSVRYREVHALASVDLVVRPGEACGLVGMNGSGKSTLMRAVLGLVPSTGRVRVLGGPAREALAAGLVGYVPQQDEIDPDFPIAVRDVVMMGRYHRMGPLRRPTPADDAAVDEALARVDLTGLAGRRLGRLSGGQRQRVLLARSLAQDARLLLLDEPFTGLDVPSQRALQGVLADLVADGRSVLVTSHDLTVLPELCSRAVLLQQRVLAAGPTAQVLTPANLARTFGLDVTEGQA